MPGVALASVSLLAVALSLGALPRVVAQVDPDVATETCAVTLGIEDDDPVRLEEFNLGQQILVRDEGDCAPPNVRVRATLRGEPDDYRLGETMSEDDGRYVIRGVIPSGADFGAHLLVIDAGENRYTKAIQIVRKAETEPIDRFRIAAIASAALLVALGLGVLVFPSRRRRRRRRAAVGVQSGVPFIDTSGFVPSRDDSHRAENEQEPEGIGPERKTAKRSRKPKQDESGDINEPTPPTP